MKVPPLKIVIPQSGNNEGDSGSNRNGKANSQRTHAALPYVVTSNSNDSDKVYVLFLTKYLFTTICILIELLIFIYQSKCLSL